jgi:hypothetical protein
MDQKMKKVEMAIVMDETFKRLAQLREAGQKEYAHNEDESFANFDRIAKQLQMDRKKVLWTYVYKHIDGVVSYLNGHHSQRESVHGRIDDIHVYLELLRGMIIDEGELIMPIQEEKIKGVPVISWNNFMAWKDDFMNTQELESRIRLVPEKYLNEKM